MNTSANNSNDDDENDSSDDDNASERQAATQAPRHRPYRPCPNEQPFHSPLPPPPRLHSSHRHRPSNSPNSIRNQATNTAQTEPRGQPSAMHEHQHLLQHPQTVPAGQRTGHTLPSKHQQAKSTAATAGAPASSAGTQRLAEGSSRKRSRRSRSNNATDVHTTALRARFIENATPFDVLMGKGKPYQNHPGNLRLHHIVNKYREAYATSTSRADKPKIANLVLSLVKSEGGARFLRRVDYVGATDMWEQVSDEMACDKISHAFRNRPRQESDLEPGLRILRKLNSQQVASSMPAPFKQHNQSAQQSHPARSAQSFQAQPRSDQNSATTSTSPQPLSASAVATTASQPSLSPTAALSVRQLNSHPAPSSQGSQQVAPTQNRTQLERLLAAGRQQVGPSTASRPSSAAPSQSAAAVPPSPMDLSVMRNAAVSGSLQSTSPDRSLLIAALTALGQRENPTSPQTNEGTEQQRTRGNHEFGTVDLVRLAISLRQRQQQQQSSHNSSAHGPLLSNLIRLSGSAEAFPYRTATHASSQGMSSGNEQLLQSLALQDALLQLSIPRQASERSDSSMQSHALSSLDALIRLSGNHQIPPTATSLFPSTNIPSNFVQTTQFQIQILHLQHLQRNQSLPPQQQLGQEQNRKRTAEPHRQASSSAFRPPSNVTASTSSPQDPVITQNLAAAQETERYRQILLASVMSVSSSQSQSSRLATPPLNSHTGVEENNSDGKPPGTDG